MNVRAEVLKVRKVFLYLISKRISRASVQRSEQRNVQMSFYFIFYFVLLLSLSLFTVPTESDGHGTISLHIKRYCSERKGMAPWRHKGKGPVRFCFVFPFGASPKHAHHVESARELQTAVQPRPDPRLQQFSAPRRCRRPAARSHQISPNRQWR